MASALQHLRAIGLRPVKNQSHGLSSDGDYASYECYDSADPGPSIPLSKAIKHKPKESFENVWSVSHGFNPPGHTDTSWASSISPSANFQTKLLKTTIPGGTVLQTLFENTIVKLTLCSAALLAALCEIVRSGQVHFKGHHGVAILALLKVIRCSSLVRDAWQQKQNKNKNNKNA